MLPEHVNRVRIERSSLTLRSRLPALFERLHG
jgi:hypothetical protein